MSGAGEDQTADMALPMPEVSLAEASGVAADLQDLRAALQAAIAAEQVRVPARRRARASATRSPSGR